MKYHLGNFNQLKPIRGRQRRASNLSGITINVYKTGKDVNYHTLDITLSPEKQKILELPIGGRAQIKYSPRDNHLLIAKGDTYKVKKARGSRDNACISVALNRGAHNDPMEDRKYQTTGISEDNFIILKTNSPTLIINLTQYRKEQCLPI